MGMMALPFAAAQSSDRGADPQFQNQSRDFATQQVALPSQEEAEQTDEQEKEVEFFGITVELLGLGEALGAAREFGSKYLACSLRGAPPNPESPVKEGTRTCGRACERPLRSCGR